METINNVMTIKEINSKTRELRNEAADLDKLFHDAVVKYLDTIVGVASCGSGDRDGKACLEEISTWYDSDDDLVTIEYVIMDKYGYFVQDITAQVSSSEIDKYISK